MKSPTQDDLDRFVRNNVHYCVSALVSTLASGYGEPSYIAGRQGASDLSELMQQAFELSSPVDDYEEAATQEGWRLVKCDDGTFDAIEKDEDSPTLHNLDPDSAWQEVCEHARLDPYQWEIYEHWIVSDWLADALERHGERVDKDFASLTVWGRTTTGQGIAGDSVIEKIWRELHKEDEA